MYNGDVTMPKLWWNGDKYLGPAVLLQHIDDC